MNKTFKAEFTANGKKYSTTISNCMNEMHALVKLKAFIEKKYGKEYQITKCYEDIFSMFGDIFKTR